ncbi:quinone oxidoreductase [Phenylobacterium sp. SCN 70-31]|uniref:quinone oxidoreductase family protein n=1 Tax=Phenylobacterium sp. SCN 70-31 TaxID=1660129 RepID=UPI00086E41EB|nr:quinone oxidoreductase [Phenylobacterium sp. SCN 70-31]ODT88232.1 MAG: quinone oxidoreductase [Phenylobacterium sp. SCN 70-31]
MKAIRFERTGGPEVLEVVDLPTPEPGPGQVLVRHEAVGINFIDTYHRTGLYPVKLPCTPGGEAAGVIQAVGDGVVRHKVGDRVAYMSGFGAYAEANVVAADRAVRIPDGFDSRIAAAILLKGMTTEAFIRRTYPVKAGETVLVHAAVGGVGQIMTQWLKALGAEVIATVGSEAKAAKARELGADHVVLYREQDVAAEVRRITGGKGVPVAYDSVGKDTFEGTLASLARRGLFVSFGNASGPVPPFAPGRLAQGGSLYLTRPTLFDYVATTEELDASAAAVFDIVASGKVKIEIGQTFPLADARKAHEALESRSTVGASLLIP